jgi:hypothetical protein
MMLEATHYLYQTQHYVDDNVRLIKEYFKLFNMLYDITWFGTVYA